MAPRAGPCRQSEIGCVDAWALCQYLRLIIGLCSRLLREHSCLYYYTVLYTPNHTKVTKLFTLISHTTMANQQMHKLHALSLLPASSQHHQSLQGFWCEVRRQCYSCVEPLATGCVAMQLCKLRDGTRRPILPQSTEYL